jgi:hypothetical protein
MTSSADLTCRFENSATACRPKTKAPGPAPVRFRELEVDRVPSLFDSQVVPFDQQWSRPETWWPGDPIDPAGRTVGSDFFEEGFE